MPFPKFNLNLRFNLGVDDWTAERAEQIAHMRYDLGFYDLPLNLQQEVVQEALMDYSNYMAMLEDMEKKDV